MTTFFTSDTHFLHKNIVVYCERPFKTLDGQPDVPAQIEGLIQRWNARVQPGDTVYHLGDFFGFANKAKLAKVAEIRRRLNGKIVLIVGNHDHQMKQWLLPEDQYYGFLTLGKVWMCHTPPLGFDGRYPVPVEPEGVELVLCGHVHDSWVEAKSNKGTRVINVGVDVWGWEPKTAAELGFEEGLLGTL